MELKGAWEVSTEGRGEYIVEGTRIRSIFTPEDEQEVRNAVWNVGLKCKHGSAYWKVTIEEGNVSPVEIGLTDMSKFRSLPEWKCLALVYEQGNLRDGTLSGNNNMLGRKTGRLVNEFGPMLKSGDTFGILCQVTRENLKVIFDVNGSSLGVAFDVPRETLGNKILPFIRFLDSAVVSIAQSNGNDFPSITRVTPKEEGLEGRWTYEEGPAPKSCSAQLRFFGTNNDKVYNAELGIFNTPSFKCEQQSDGTWKTSKAAYTCIGYDEGIPANSEIPRFVTNRFLHLDISGDVLTIKGLDGSDMTVWKRFYFVPEIVTWNPFAPFTEPHWIHCNFSCCFKKTPSIRKQLYL